MPTINENCGTLSRANKLISDESKGLSELLGHNCRSPSGVMHSSERPPTRRTRIQYRARTRQIRATFVLIKMQESALKFLFRLLLLDNDDDEDNDGNKHKNRGRSTKADYMKTKQQSKARLLLAGVDLLPNKSWLNIAKFVLWRWLTLANVFELILLISLLYGCGYQCQLFLEEYYMYPTHIRVTKVLNDDFRADLPALTLCDNNRISLDALAKHNPRLNESHFLAMTLGTFNGVDNFSLNALDLANREEVSKSLDTMRRGFFALDPGSNNNNNNNLNINLNINNNNEQRGRKAAAPTRMLSAQIDWSMVANYLSNMTIAGSKAYLPHRDLVDQVNCADIWGENVPCARLERIFHIQNEMACVTLFHDSIFWDPSYEPVRQVESELARHTSKVTFGQGNSPDGRSVDNLIKLSQDEIADINRSVQDIKSVEMNVFEMIRVKLNFRANDYANRRTDVGALVSVHSNNFIGLINHNRDFVQPGRWYTYYIERFDHKRLEYPYRDNCYDYEQNRYVFSKRIKWEQNNADYFTKLVHKQASNLGQIINEYGHSLRQTTLGSVSSDDDADPKQLSAYQTNP